MVSVVLFGDKPGAVRALEYMYSIGWKIKSVVSAMTERSFISGPTLQETSNKYGIPFITQEEFLSDYIEPVDLVISYMYRNLVREESLKLARVAAVNFHAAPLPRFGGWAFYSVAILEEVKKYGVTCHHMDTGFDTGDICMQEFFEISSENETAFSLEKKAQSAMFFLFKSFCSHISLGKDLPRKPQLKEEMRYLKKKEFDNLKRIPDGADYHVIQKYARAFWYPPYDLAYILTDGKKIEIMPNIVKEEIARYMHLNDYQNIIAYKK